MFILEAFTIVGLLTIMFYNQLGAKLGYKHLIVFILTCGAIYGSELIQIPLVPELCILISSTLIFCVIMKVSIVKTFITNLICLVGMLIIQFWIPLYSLITNTSTETISNNFSFYGLPCRAVEYIILFLIYSFKIKPAIVSQSVLKLASNVSRTTSIWWVYQPKEPKCLKK